MFIIGNLFMLLFFRPEKHFSFASSSSSPLQVHVCDIVAYANFGRLWCTSYTVLWLPCTTGSVHALDSDSRQPRKNRILFKWKGHSTETCCTAKCNSAARIKISASSSPSSALAQNFNFFSSRRATCWYFFSANEIEIVFFLLSSSAYFYP